MKIVILDGGLTNPGDLSWDPVKMLGNVTVYARTEDSKIVERSSDAEVIITNKVCIDAGVIKKLPKLKCICLLATGYNNIDIDAARKHNITVTNAVGYSTHSVAQHVMALTLHFSNQIALHARSVSRGDWANHEWSYSLTPLTELKGQVMGIYGFGRIGRQVAQLASAFGMHIFSHHKHAHRDAQPGVEFVSFESLLSVSDVLTLHAPLTEANTEIINSISLKKMKQSAILINTGRGGLINEAHLAEALTSGRLRGAGLDVLQEEPPLKSNPLIGIDNCIITPHQAWATKQSRARLIQMVADNIKAYQNGRPIHVVT